jgi:hypothetical protein
MCECGIVLANWVPWNAADCTSLGSDDEFGCILFVNDTCAASGRSTPSMTKFPLCARVKQAVGKNNSQSIMHVAARPVVPVSKTPVPAAVRRHTRNKNHSPFKIASLKASYKENSNPGNNEKQQIAHSLEMTVMQVSTWFCNYRKRNHRHPTPVAP